ncbi:MAG: hypothetical protein BWX88_01729 [Planctomycetes bacterium ADurb.Bin126]|nr:MAG: hypothetical protein BWX88_01729 [Planctomycetes bacterium ADurb.Bin126]
MSESRTPFSGHTSFYASSESSLWPKILIGLALAAAAGIAAGLWWWLK